MNDDDAKPTVKPSPFEELFGIEPGSTPISGKRVHIAPDSIAATDMILREKSLLNPTTGDVIERKVEDVNEQDLAIEERIEDLHIDGQLDTIREAAMLAFEDQRKMSQESDPRFSARNAEVAAQYLNIALNAVDSRVDAKYKRNKIKLAKGEKGAQPPTGRSTTVIIADRNAVLRAVTGLTEKIIEDTPE